ncbi:MAG: NapC/NirT family cytochrome c [bacterium]
MKKQSKIKKILIFIGALAIVLLLSSPFYINARKPSAVCLMCHEMRSPYLSWRTSTHRKSLCTECHVSPGGYRMILSHLTGPAVPWSEKREASFKTCVRCHSEIRGIVYFHSIKFPHEAHQKYLADCRVCHENVVHGSRIEYRHPPKKETCYTCHDNRRASRDCHLCHLTFTKELPQQLDPNWIESHKSDTARFSRACSSCHKKKFCTDCHLQVNPHPATWIKAHQAKARRTTRKCQTCHTSQNCTNCHGILQQHQLEWYDGHRRLARKSDKLCRRCHDAAFCDSCHQGFTLHQAGWAKLHRDDPSSKKAAECATCHTKKYCQNCHGGKPTLHHKGNWLSHHAEAVSNGHVRDLESCITCHSPGFCLACHRGLKKNVHARNYLAMHTGVTPQSMTQCKMCHTIESCNQCHTSNLPATHRADEWKNTHGLNAIRNMASCTLCHEQQFCEACHSKKIPSSHEPKKTWLKQHGTGSRREESRCSLCHENQFCNICHKRSKPTDHYIDSWPLTHGKSAMFDMSSCSVCHDKKDCKGCHGDGTIHKAAGWMKNHDVSREEKGFEQCSQCHWLGTCVDCHKRFNIKGHADCSNCHVSMSKPEKLRSSPCASCHKGSANTVHKKHEGLQCDVCHAPHAWKPSLSACSTCHDMGEEHTMGNSCMDCHAFK